MAEEESKKSVEDEQQSESEGESKKLAILKKFTYFTRLLESTMYSEGKAVPAVVFPEALLKVLMDDWYAVSFEENIKELPRSPNMEEIVADVSKILEAPDKYSQPVMEVIRSITEYVRCAFPNFLLYSKREKEQYAKIKAEYQATPYRIYGLEHLLRLFVIFPKLISTDWFTSEDYSTFVSSCEAILKTISERLEAYKNWAGPKLENIERTKHK